MACSLAVIAAQYAAHRSLSVNTIIVKGIPQVGHSVCGRVFDQIQHERQVGKRYVYIALTDPSKHLHPVAIDQIL